MKRTVAFSALVLAMGLASPVVSGQTAFEVAPLGKVDPWGLGSLSRSDGALSNTLWQETSPEILVKLLETTDTAALSPSARKLMRQVVLSSARAPEGKGADDLLKRRVAAIRALGEVSEFDLFVRQFPEDAGFESGAAALADLDLARGNDASACRLVQSASGENASDLTLRAICFALTGNTGSAQLALELAGEDGWTADAITYLASDRETKAPEARYDSGASIALSTAGELTSDAPGDLPLLLAPILAGRSDIAPALRLAAADRAVAAGLIAPDVWRDLYIAETEAALEEIDRSADDGADPKDEAEAAATSGDDSSTGVETGADTDLPPHLKTPYALAFAATQDRSIATDELAKLFLDALGKAASDPGLFNAVAQALETDIARLPRTPQTALFASRLGLLMGMEGQTRTARSWQQAMEREGGPPVDEFASTLIDAAIIIAGSDTSEESARVTSSFLASAKPEADKALAERLLAVMVALDRPLSAEARAFLAERAGARTTNTRKLDPVLLSAALVSDAAAESRLRLASAIGTDAALLSPADLSLVINTLKTANARDAARAVAFEGSGLRQRFAASK